MERQDSSPSSSRRRIVEKGRIGFVTARNVYLLQIRGSGLIETSARQGRGTSAAHLPSGSSRARRPATGFSRLGRLWLWKAAANHRGDFSNVAGGFGISHQLLDVLFDLFLLIGVQLDGSLLGGKNVGMH